MTLQSDRAYYVTMRRAARVAFLAGPYETHDEALAKVKAATDLAIEHDPFHHFDEFGTASLAKDFPKLPEGKFNARIN